MNIRAQLARKAIQLGLALAVILAVAGNGPAATSGSAAMATTATQASQTDQAPQAGLTGPGYTVNVLVSDLPGLGINDTKLVNPWGIARNSSGPWWVANNGTGTSTVYNGSGQKFPSGSPLVVTLPPASGSTGPAVPTGMVANEEGGFEVTAGNSAQFIFVAEDGSIYGWSQSVDQSNAKLMTTVPDAIYKGATLAKRGGQSFLYATNFSAGTVDVFDSAFKKVSIGQGAFVDSTLPAGFAPFGIQAVDGKIYVTYAKQSADKADDVAGAGLGFVTVYDANGGLLSRLQGGDRLNAPWAVALAPAGFGEASSRILVGNFGNGKILVFNPDNGQFLDFLKDQFGRHIIIDGLWGLAFGNGATAGSDDTLFFAAGINDEEHGEFGSITAVAGASGGTAGSIGGTSGSQGQATSSGATQGASGTTTGTGTPASTATTPATGSGSVLYPQ